MDGAIESAVVSTRARAPIPRINFGGWPGAADCWMIGLPLLLLLPPWGLQAFHTTNTLLSCWHFGILLLYNFHYFCAILNLAFLSLCSFVHLFESTWLFTHFLVSGF
jgi:hypothetical protein